MEVKAEGRKLEEIFKSNVTYVVPDYQRPYSWERNQIDDLFNDLEEAINSNTNHYFGAFVFNMEKESEKIIEIIDGQQRLTTVAIFLYVLNYIYNLDRYKNLKGVEHRRNTLKQYLEFLNADGETVGLKLELGEVNKDFFKKYIVKGWDKDSDYKDEVIKEFKDRNKFSASKQIKEAFDIILEHINKKIEGLDADDAINEIKKYHDTLLGKFDIVEIKVKQDADAFLIFETLNDRGLALSQVDLIKNKLFKNCAGKEEFENIKEKWIDMVENLEDISIIKKYLRHYWIANYENTTHQSLFKSVRDKIGNDYDLSKSVIYDLNKMAIYYDGLSNPNNGVFSNKKLIKAIADMNMLKFDLTHPILIAAFKHFKNDEDKLYRVVKICLNFLIRYITVMKGKPSNVEKEIGKHARNLKTDISIISNLFNEYAKDSEFKEAMKTFTPNYKSPSTYYILTEYEKTLHNEDWIPPARTSVTIEHILPKAVDYSKKLQNEWVQLFTKEEHEIYLNKLGNLTLLGPRAQGKASNKIFSEKKKIYKTDTDMKMTQQLTQIDKWTKDEIDKRQVKIAEAAVEIFTLNLNKI